MATDPLPPAAQGAHKLVTLLRTSIATQHLPYQHGTEKRALESIYELFIEARQIILAHPDERFAATVSEMLNNKLRPFTAKWHLLSEQGMLSSRDGGDAFRGELQELQKNLQQYAHIFHCMAYDSEWLEKNEETPQAIDKVELLKVFESLRYGIPEDESLNGGIPTKKAKTINMDEEREVTGRRGNTCPDLSVNEDHDAVGLAFSGGGIRSATFCLGVAQVLADKRLMRQVDFLSTVSGGGYTGGFLAYRMGEGASEAELGGAQGPDPVPIRYLRLRAKFLAAGNLWDAWSMVCTTVAGMLLNWMVPLFVVTMAAICATVWKVLVLWGSGLLLGTYIGAIVAVISLQTDLYVVPSGCEVLGL